MTDQWVNRIVGQGEVDPEQLLANPLNWRIHPRVQQDALEGAIEEIGWIDEIIVNQRTGYVLDGHLRVSLALKRDQALVPVKYVDLSEDEEKIAIATIDPITAMAVTDKELLEDLLTGINTDNELLLSLFDDIAKREKLNIPVVEDPGAGMDRADELQEKWQVERGQLWQIGDHRLMCGDSTSEDDVGLLMEEDKADLVLTDPPYGVDYTGGDTTPRERLIGDESPDVYVEFLAVLGGSIHGHCPLYLWYADVKSREAANALFAAKWIIRSAIIWHKTQAHFGNLGQQYKMKHESMYYCFQKGKTPQWFGPTNEVSVWEQDQPTHNEYHPTQKPIEIMARAIGNSSKKGNIVLDPFIGSGTTMVAAQQLNRICYGMEIEPKYCSVTLERMSNMELKPELIK